MLTHHLFLFKRITNLYLPSLSSIPTTIVKVVPNGTIPFTGLAHGPLPCWISIQQSTLSPIKHNRRITFQANETIRIYLYKPKCEKIYQTHTSEVKLNHFYIWYSYWWFCNSFFVIIVPLASQAFRFIPYLYEILIILNNYIVFVKFSIQVRFGTTLVIQDVKFVLSPASLGCYINTVVLIYGSL